MKIPNTFLPERSLDHKVKELLKEQNAKKPFEDPALYGAISSNLKALLRMPKEDSVRIFWISDEHQTSRYEYVEKIINETITESGKKPAYEIHNFYDNNFGRINLCMILDKHMGGLFQIVYTAHETTEKLRKDSSAYSPLFDRMLVIFI